MVDPNNFTILLIQLLIIIFQYKVEGGIFTGYKDPVIQITKWLESDDYQWRDYRESEAGFNYNSSVLVIPGDVVGLILECNASYPIEIIFEVNEVLGDENIYMFYNVYTKARREAKSISDKSTHQYSMKYQLYSSTNQFTGSYVCKGTQHPDLHSKIYMMWEGNSPPYIIGASSTTTVSTHNKKSIILPCRVSTTDVDVILEKEMNITNDANETSIQFETLNLNDSIIYDPTYGFNLNVEQLPTIEGNYKCSTYELDDYINFNVTSVPAPEKQYTPTMRVSETATFDYEPKDYSLICCSNSPTPPKLIFMVCPTPTICKMLREMVVRNAHLFANFHFGMITNDKNCTRHPIWGYSGLALCKGDGIDTNLEVFFPVERNKNESRLDDIYLKWSDAKPEHLLRIHALSVSTNLYHDYYGRKYFYNIETPWPKGDPMYSGQNVSFRCETSPYYFASGIKWEIELKNSTKEYPDASDIGDLDSYMQYWMHSNPISTILHRDIAAITCFAPVWNSSEWITKRYDLNISDPISPNIYTSTPDISYWTLNDTDKSIECKSDGEPRPFMKWMKNGKEIVSDQNVNLDVPEYGTFLLQFKTVSYDVHGDYTCVSSNFAFSVEKTFTVIVEEPHPWTAIIIITVAGVILILAAGLLIWRIKVQRNMAEHIRRTEFQRSQDQD